MIPSKVSDLGQNERFTGIQKILAAKTEWMVKNGIMWPWKGNERNESRFDSKAARLCLHWLQSDQENENVRQMSSDIPKKVESVVASYVDKLYEIKWEDLIIRECIRRGVICSI